MRYENSFTREMIKYMLSIFGLSDYSTYNTIGIIKDEFKTDLNIKIQYDIGPIEKHPIFSASTTFNESKLHVVGCSVADDDGSYCAVLFKLDNYNTYAIKLNMSDSAELPIFLVSKVKGNWSKLSMYDKIIACAGLEKLNDAGIVWKAEPIGDFYNILVEVVEM